MNQILYTGEEKKEKSNLKKEGMVLISTLIIIIIVTILIFNVSSFKIESKAMTQEEILKEQEVSEESNTEEVAKEDTIQVVLPQEEKQETSEPTEIVEPVKKTVKSSTGKSYETIAILNIPSLNIEYPVLSSTSTELLKISLNKYWGANPNEVGNLCIVGHNYEDDRFFGNLSKIKMGAEIYITDMTGRTLTYNVYHTEVVGPYDTQCTSQLTDGHTEITLITCHDGGATRFVVKARAN